MLDMSHLKVSWLFYFKDSISFSCFRNCWNVYVKMFKVTFDTNSLILSSLCVLEFDFCIVITFKLYNQSIVHKNKKNLCEDDSHSLNVLVIALLQIKEKSQNAFKKDFKCN